MLLNLDKLQQQIGYQFSDQALAGRALTHRSANTFNNERLEFLGDSLLGCIVAELLYAGYPDATEGELSRARANVVDQRTLAAIAREIELPDQLQLGTGERKSGGKQRDSILADAVEALIAAVYLDGGMDACRSVVANWIEPRLSSVRVGQSQKDAKTRLQELMQARGSNLPEYRVARIEGEAHEQTFVVECAIPLLEQPEQGSGGSKRAAEQAAAQRTLERLGEAV